MGVLKATLKAAKAKLMRAHQPSDELATAKQKILAAHKPEEPDDTVFSGSLDTVHGSDRELQDLSDPSDVVDDFKGEPDNDYGSAFYSAEPHNTEWMEGRFGWETPENAYKAKVNFKNALVVSPSTLGGVVQKVTGRSMKELIEDARGAAADGSYDSLTRIGERARRQAGADDFEEMESNEALFDSALRKHYGAKGDWRFSHKLGEWAREAGHDGIIVRGWDGTVGGGMFQDQVITFDPKTSVSDFSKYDDFYKDNPAGRKVAHSREEVTEEDYDAYFAKQRDLRDEVAAAKRQLMIKMGLWDE